ncbi:MAG: electron transfer flavoprotein subunit beta/FixA family protein [Candidatus Carbobacillus altaicus]|uniref:Electron transfer flavoprotein subunit beta n=1 Tax=Candidatus Carbonibacillus altaicus TaxID=2163959 RepID=A0A2R6Y4H5_9BACL|nr:electron transfer flavoprotein subunit beta/FixA family protein [Candidatus Carbobacillus altaicus]PTQ57552.1 MAG: Electron transfer flavoprotein, beta subunit [Candidatus Carbobacillus altaicus]
MKIVVLLKQTFDTEEKVVIENGVIKEDGAQFVINPYDEYAVEEAIRIKENGDAEVVVVSYGPARVEDALRKALAMGADRAVLIEADHPVTDEAGVAEVLAKAVEKEAPDLILAGNFSVDNGAGQVAPRVAEILGLNHVGAVTKVTLEGDDVVVERDAEGDLERIRTKLPLLLTAQQGLNDPRYPSLPGIMKAKKKPLDRLTLSDLGLGDISPRTTVTNRYNPPKKEAGEILQGDIATQVETLVKKLREEAKVI